MVDGLPGVLGVNAHRSVVKHFDHEHELVQILNQKIMVDYVLDLIEKKNYVQKEFVQMVKLKFVFFVFFFK